MNGLGNLGMGQTDELPPTGVEYVIGNQQGQAVLRARRAMLHAMRQHQCQPRRRHRWQPRRQLRRPQLQPPRSTCRQCSAPPA